VRAHEDPYKRVQGVLRPDAGCLAQNVGVRRETIVFLEKGKYNPSLKLAHDVVVALGATIDELFLWDGKEEE
jgi:putative transcriptional regulator